MRHLLIFAALPFALTAQSTDFLIPGFALEHPLYVACLSPQAGTISIEVLNPAGEPLARIEKTLKVKTWQSWPVFDGAAAGVGSLRVRLSESGSFSLNGFFFLGRDKPFQTDGLPPATFCQNSCFQLVPASAPRVGRFQFTLPQEAAVSARVLSSSKPPRVVVNEILGRRPAGANSFEWDLVLHPPQGADHVGLFTLTGSREFVVVFARVDK
jgi:hypothetical protein